MRLLDKYDIIVLDCDGIIFDSNTLKTDAFRATVSPWGHVLADDFLEYVRRSFGSSRYLMFRTFIAEYLRQDFDQALYDKLLDDFSRKSEELYSQAEFCTGFHEFCETYQEKPLYVASGSDQSELRRVFDKRGIAHSFKDVLGSPEKKSDILAKIKTGHFGKNIVMIGDAQADAMASLNNEIEFVFVSKYSLDKENVQQISSQNQFTTVETLIDLL